MTSWKERNVREFWPGQDEKKKVKHVKIHFKENDDEKKKLNNVSAEDVCAQLRTSSATYLVYIIVPYIMHR